MSFTGGEDSMFCHSCGTQVGSEVQFCPNCGQSLGVSPVSPGVAPPPAWTPPARVRVTPGHWLSEGWNLVQADLGSYVLFTLIFFLLTSVPFIQGALIAGFHIYTMKKLMGRRAEFGDLFKGFNFFIQALVATVLIGVFTFFGLLLLI